MPEATCIPTPTCPVAEMAAELHRVIAAGNRIEDASLGVTGSRRIELDAQYRALEDRREALEEAASHEITRSWAGAMLQLMLLGSAADALSGLAFQEDDPLTGDYERRIDGLAYSLMTFMERTSGLNREDFAGDYYMTREFDPHARFAQALAP